MSINKDSKKAPNIRFKDFTDDWEQRELQNLVTSVTREVAKPNKPYKRLSIRSHAKGTFHKFVENPDTVSMDRLYVVHENDLVVNITFAWEHAIAVATQEDDGLLVSHRFPTFLIDKSDINFTKYLVSQESFRRKMELISPGGAGRNKVLNKKDFVKLKLNIPTRLDEQYKIGKFFKVLDDAITLHQRKLDQLNQLKEALLQQMFPGKGETVPKLRFAGFEGDWEERKLGEIGETKSGIGFPVDEQGGKTGIPFFKVSDMNNIGNEYELKNSNNYVDTEQLKKRNWKPIMNVPAVIFAKVGAAIMLNRKRIVRMPFLLDNNTMAYIFDDSWNSDFGKILFETIYLPRYAQVGALPSYNGSDIKSIKVFIPTKKEQEKIGVFFKEMDNTITLHQRKLDQLQNMKQVLLQNMFI